MATGTMDTGEVKACEACEAIAADGLLLDVYISEMETGDQTKTNERRQVLAFLRFCETNGLNADRDGLVSYKERLIEDRHTSGTINAYLSAGQRFIRWAADRHGTPQPKRVRGVPMGDGFRRHEVPQEAVRAMVKGEATQRTTGVGRSRDAAIVALMATGGFRCREVSLMDIGDCCEQADGSAIVQVQGKGHVSKDASCCVPAAAWAKVKEYLAFRADATPDQPLFVSTSNNSRGQRLTSKGLSAIVKEQLRALGIDTPTITAHGLRHFCGTQAIRGGFDIVSVSRQLRHTSIAITQRYIEGVGRSEIADYLGRLIE